MKIALVSQFHVYLPCLGACLAWCLKCESTSRRFQTVEGPSGAFFVIVKTDGSFAALVLTCSCFNIHLLPFHNMGEKCSRVSRANVFPYYSVNVKCSLSYVSVYFNDCKKSLKWRGSVCLGSIFTCNLHRGAAVSAARCLPGKRWSWQAVKQQSWQTQRCLYLLTL